MLPSPWKPSIKSLTTPQGAYCAEKGEMVVNVISPFDLILEVYCEIFDKPGVSPQLTWEIRDQLDNSAFDLLGRIDDYSLGYTIRELKVKTLQEALEGVPPRSSTATEISTVWWCLHRKHVNPDDY